MSLPSYPKYKPSGVEWLGPVPEEWKVAPLKVHASHNDDVLDEATAPNLEITYVDISNVDGTKGIIAKEALQFSGAPSRARRRVKHGDVIVSTVRTYLKAVARIRDPEENLIVSTGFAVIRPKGSLQPDFLGYLVSCSYFVEQVIAKSTGVSYPAINASELVAIPVVVPPSSDQDGIGSFLDRETAKIDALVAEQQLLIELLKEKRQAVISHAVTKGLNPQVPLKPSGIEWLGEVPAHWKATRLKYLCEVIVDCPHETPVYSEDGPFRVIRTADLEEGVIDEAQMYRVTESEYLNRIRRAPLLRNDIVYGREGERWGHAALIPEGGQFCLGQRMMQMRPVKNVCPEFLMWQLNARTTYTQGDVDTVGATSPHVNVATIRNYNLTYPPLGEQREIAFFLRQVTQQLDSLVAEAQHGIDLLQERRTALISAAVTGQIDVRDLGEKQSA